MGFGFGKTRVGNTSINIGYILQNKHGCGQARNQEGAFAPPKISRLCTAVLTFADFQRIKKILYSNHFSVLFEFFFVLLVNYLLTKFFETGYLIEYFGNDWYF